MKASRCRIEGRVPSIHRKGGALPPERVRLLRACGVPNSGGTADKELFALNVIDCAFGAIFVSVRKNEKELNHFEGTRKEL